MESAKLPAALLGMLAGFSLAADAQQPLEAVTNDMSANAASAITAEVSASLVTRVGDVSVTELAASEANRQAFQSLLNVAEEEKPPHRLRDGSLTSEAKPQTLNALPRTTNPESAVVSIHPGFATTRGFTGIHVGDNVTANRSAPEPPDQGLAVNNNVAAEINNDVLRFFNATTGAALTAPIANSTFFNAAGFSLTDTQAFFDPVSKRWFLYTVMSSSTFDGYGFAVSQTSNPLGGYWIYHIRAFSNTVQGCGGKDCFPDYAKAGYDANAFFIAADLFNNATSKFVESAIYVIPKAKLEAGASFSFVRMDDRADFVVQPSVPAPGEPFSSADNGSEFLLSAPGSAKVAVLAIINTNNIVSSPGSLKLYRTTVPSQSYGAGTVPMTQPNVVGPYCASVGVTSAPKLDGGYSAFSATVQKAGGNLYGALAFGAKDGLGLNRDVIGWFEMHPTLTATALSASIVHQGIVVPPDGYSISYAAFGLNKTGAGALGMTITNKSGAVAGGYPSAAFMQFSGTAFTGPITITGQGFTSDDGFTGCPGSGPGKVGRWGDYAAATVDAVTGYIYTVNEMIPNPARYTRATAANWGTFITQLH